MQLMEQEIKFCTTGDNVRIAYSCVGEGPPFVKAANWMNHLEHDLNSPMWRHVIEEFSRDHRFIRYDERGNGLSDWNVENLSLDVFVDDLEAVVDAVGIKNFPLFGISQGGAVAVAYAARHPERVSHLILYNAFATGWMKANVDPQIIAQRKAQATLIQHGWGQKNPAFRQLWTTLVIPDSTPDEADWFNETQRVSTSAANAARIFEAIGELDVAEILPQLDLPVLVLHCRGDSTVPFEEGRRMASLIHNARFVPLESNNHLILSREAAWPKFVQEIRRFLGRETPHPAGAKECRTCGRTYFDKEILYCLEDGTRLETMTGTSQERQAEEQQSTMILPNRSD